jgi:hypothetical protein
MHWSGPYQSDPRKIQEVIFYCASRLRAIVIDLTKEENNYKRSWKQRLFLQELVNLFLIKPF